MGAFVAGFEKRNSIHRHFLVRKLDFAFCIAVFESLTAAPDKLPAAQLVSLSASSCGIRHLNDLRRRMNNSDIAIPSDAP
jgi:hypothetical protein